MRDANFCARFLVENGWRGLDLLFVTVHDMLRIAKLLFCVTAESYLLPSPYHCCQVSPRFPGQSEKKNSAKYPKNSAKSYKYFFKTQNIDFLSKLSLNSSKQLKSVFRTLFLPLLANIGDCTPTATKIPRPEDIFLRPLSSYFAVFSATRQQCSPYQWM